MARRKTAALVDVPQSTEAAIALLDEYRQVERQGIVDRLVADAIVTEAKTRLAELLAGREPQQKARFAALQAWWEAGGKDMAGKKRSAELAGATLGVRLSTPAVKFGKGWSAKKVLERLRGLRWSKASRFMRTKVELDKQAIIKEFGQADVARTLGVMLDVVQTDEFFIDTGLDEGEVLNQLNTSNQEQN